MARVEHEPDTAAAAGASSTASSTGSTTRRSAWRIDAIVLAIGALIVRLPALFAPRHLTFDDGQYGTVVLGLRAGDLPFQDLFSSQGPLYYPLLGAADLVGLRTLDGPRVLPVAAGAVAAVTTYAIARHMTGRWPAVLAGALVATSGSLVFVTGPLSGDGPALALALTSVALACTYRARPSLGRAVLIGLAMGAALCVKLIVAPAAIAVGVLVLPTRLLGPTSGEEHRRWRDGMVAVASAVAVAIVSALPWGLERVWDQSVAYHRDSERLRSYGGNAWTLLQTLAERDPFVLGALVASGVTVLVVWWRRSHGTAAAASPADGGSSADLGVRAALVVLVPWTLAQAAFLVAEPAMWRPHVSQIVAPLALLAVLRPAPWRVLAVLGVLLLPWWIVNVRPMLWPESYSRSEESVVERFRSLPDEALVISDDPGFAWRADRRVPGDYVDVSMKRFQQGALTKADVLRDATDPRVCAVLVWSGDRLGSLPGLGAGLEARGYEVAQRYPGSTERVLYERSDCEPSGERRSGS